MEEGIKAYDAYRHLSQKEGGLPENVRHDLNIDDLYDRLDYTSSGVGRQYLYHLLCTDKVSEVCDYEPLMERFQADEALRKLLTEVLAKLNKPASYTVVDVLAEERHTYSRRYLFLLQVCRWLPLLFLSFTLLTDVPAVPFVLLILSYMVNGYLHFKQKSMLACYYFSIPQLYRLMQAACRLSRIDAFTAVDRTIGVSLADLKGLIGKLRSFRLGIALQSESALLMFLFTELINVFTLYAAINVAESFLCIRKQRKEIERVFRFVGLLDVLCSVSYFRASLLYWCKPSETKEGEMLCARAICHPLIKHCVPNDVSLLNKSMLITGSNMSGKTSFIRTIAVNLLVGKVLHTCFAEEFRIHLDRRIHSVIHTEDDLLNGKSYFLKEAENVKEAVSIAQSGNYLLIFDELFKGTNTVERIAINAALFYELSKGNHIILVSTHDKELATLLRERYELYHFSETVTDNQLTFDYKLKKGIAQEGNAIKILRLYGYPDSVVKEAERIKDRGFY